MKFLLEIDMFSFAEMHLKLSSFWLSLDVLRINATDYWWAKHDHGKGNVWNVASWFHYRSVMASEITDTFLIFPEQAVGKIQTPHYWPLVSGRNVFPCHSITMPVNKLSSSYFSICAIGWSCYWYKAQRRIDKKVIVSSFDDKNVFLLRLDIAKVVFAPCV